jgi:hypothetical protein
MKLMPSKYIVRDQQTVWTGSTNLTDDAFALEENNVVEIAALREHRQDYLWQSRVSKRENPEADPRVGVELKGAFRQHEFQWRKCPRIPAISIYTD